MAMIKLLSAGTKVELSKTTVTNLTTPPILTWDDISCALTGISTESTEREQIETTSLCETYSKTYIDGLKDQDTASSDAFFNPKSPEGLALQAAANSRATYALKVTFVDGSTWESLTTVQPFGFSASVGDTLKTTINFKLIGAPKLTPAA